MQEILEGRKNYKAYSVLFTHFIPAMGRKTYWKDQVLAATDDQDVTTRSNEAFALFQGLEDNMRNNAVYSLWQSFAAAQQPAAAAA